MYAVAINAGAKAMTITHAISATRHTNDARTICRVDASQLRISGPEFRATPWRPTIIDGEAWEMSECHELVDGRWEGFVTLRRPERAER